jgi:hypothetical protein
LDLWRCKPGIEVEGLNGRIVHQPRQKPDGERAAFASLFGF